MKIEAIFEGKSGATSPKNVIVEKAIVLNKDAYERFFENPLYDYDFIENNRNLMFTDENGSFHCLLVTGRGRVDGLLLHAEDGAKNTLTSYLPDLEGITVGSVEEAMSPKEAMLNVLMVEPGATPIKTVLENSLSAMQEAVGGMIEFVYISDTAAILCNEEGKLIGLEGNRSVGNDIIVGTFYVLGHTNDGNCCSLPKDELEKYEARFMAPESFTQEEIEANSGFSVFAFG